MKNLKKAGAVALAAVMAVTFAPVASLNVFAATTSNKGTDYPANPNKIVGVGGGDTTATIDEEGDYVLGDATVTTLTFKKGTYTLDLNDVTGTNTEIVLEGGANLTIKSSDTNKNGTKEGSVKSVDVQTVDNMKVLNGGAAGDGTVTKDSFAPKEISATLTVEDGKIGTINQWFGDVTVNDGEISTGIVVKGGVYGTNNQGVDNYVATIRSSNLTINGGSIAKIEDESKQLKASDVTFKGGDIPSPTDDKNNELLKSLTINGGVFGEDPNAAATAKNQYYTAADKDVANGDASVYASAKVIAKIDLAADSWAVSNDWINKTIAKNADEIKALDKKAGNATPNVIAVRGAVELKDLPKGVYATATNKINNGENDGIGLTAAAADGVSMYATKNVHDGNNSWNATTDYAFRTGDYTIADYLQNHEVGYDTTPAPGNKNVETGVFTNGGNTNQITVDGKTYVVDLYEASAGDLDDTFFAGLVVNADKVNVDCIHLDDGDADMITHDTLFLNDTYSKAVVTADKKYSLFEGKTDDDKRGVVATAAQYLPAARTATRAAYPWTAHYLKQDKDITVSQVGDTEIGEGANGLLAIGKLTGTTVVKTTDESLPVSFDGNGVFYVGEKSNQVAAGSSKGETVETNYALAKAGKPFGATLYNALPKSGANRTMTFIQGGITLPYVATGKGKGGGLTYDKDTTATYVDFFDGANLGITKTPNYTTNEYGVSSVSSVTVTVGLGSDVNTPVSAYRFRNVKTNEHLYTIVASEIAALKANPDWQLENADAFKVLPWNTTVDGAVQVRRYRSSKGEFLYSTDTTEQANLDKDPNWTREGIAFCGVNAAKGYAVTRIVSTIGQGHAYCTSVENEVKPQVATGNWKQEGVPFFAVDIPANEK